MATDPSAGLIACTRLTVVVPATDRAPYLPRCLAAIASSSDPPEQLLVIRHAPRPGPAAARNLGAAQAEGDILVFVDSDVTVHRDAFIRIRAAFADDRLDAVFGSYDDAPAAPGAVSRFRNLLHHHVHQTAAGPAQTFWAGLGAVRRQAFAGAGGFDEVRFPTSSIEDVELGRRLAAQGCRIVLDPALRGTHLKAWTLGSMLKTDLMRRAAPWTAMACRERRLPAMLNLGWEHRFSVVACLWTVWSAWRRRPASALVGVAALVTLNRSFYALLVRTYGVRLAVAAVPLHILHYLAAVAGMPVGLVMYWRERAAYRRARRKTQWRSWATS
jgi:GT2 family glycosyltransferase